MKKSYFIATILFFAVAAYMNARLAWVDLNAAMFIILIVVVLTGAVKVGNRDDSEANNIRNSAFTAIIAGIAGMSMSVFVARLAFAPGPWYWTGGALLLAIGLTVFAYLTCKGEKVENRSLVWVTQISVALMTIISMAFEYGIVRL